MTQPRQLPDKAIGLCYDAVLGSSSHLRHNRLSRRAFLGTASLLAACAHKRAPRYRAWLFTASAAEKAVVVSDLAAFQRTAAIPLDAAPDQVFSARGKLYVVCGADQSLVRIDPARRTVIGKTATGGKVAGAAPTTDGNYVAIALSQPPAVALLDTASDRIVHRIDLPDAPLAIAATAKQIAVILGSAPNNAKPSRLARINVTNGSLLGISPIGPGPATALGYRADGETIFVAAPEARQIITLDATSGAVLARLPVPIQPARFCVDGTGGQVFVTGAGREAQLVIFKPYQNEIDQTLYAGHALFGMAVAPVLNLLFLSNPDAGEVTIVNIETRGIEASIRTGGNPREILIASSPDSRTPEEYAFVVDGDTGDVSVIHIPAVRHKRGDAIIAEAPKPLFAVFHGGSQPQSAVIIPFPG